MRPLLLRREHSESRTACERSIATDALDQISGGCVVCWVGGTGEGVAARRARMALRVVKHYQMSRRATVSSILTSPRSNIRAIPCVISPVLCSPATVRPTRDRSYICADSGRTNLEDMIVRSRLQLQYFSKIHNEVIARHIEDGRQTAQGDHSEINETTKPPTQVFFRTSCDGTTFPRVKKTERKAASRVQERD